MSMTTIQPIKAAFVPNAVTVTGIDGLTWMEFMSDGTFASFKKMPNGLKYMGKTFKKMSWNSDNNTITYKQGELAVAC